MSLSIAQRLWLGFAFVIGVGASASTLAIFQASKVDRTTHAMIDQDLAANIHASQANLSLGRADAMAERFCASPTNERAAKVSAELDAAGKELTEMARFIKTTEAQAEAKAATERLNEARQTFASLVRLYEERGFKENDGTSGRLRAAVHSVEKSVNALNKPELNVLMLMCRRHEKDYMLREEPKYAELNKTRVAEFKKLAAELNLAPDVLAGINKEIDAYAAGFAAFVAANTQSNAGQTKFRDQLAALSVGMSKLNDRFLADVSGGSGDVLQTIASQRSALIGSLVTIPLLGGLIALLIARSVLRPINSLKQRLESVANGDGDLTQRLPITGNDELTQVATLFNSFVGKLRDVMSDVLNSAEEVAAASTEIATNSEHLLAGVKQQSDRSSQVSAAVEQSSVSVVQVSDRTKQATELARQAGEFASSGGRDVAATVNNVEGISNEVETAAKIIEGLGKRSDEIGQLVTMINDIAEQTNLLALNAAIEAARAGEHGRGFAVVADEVRKLAERTTQTTGQVSQSVKNIQDETSTAVVKMQSSITRVREGVSQARKAGQSLESIVSSAHDVASMVESISATAAEQSEATKEISTAVNAISSINAEFSARSGETAAATNQLSVKAEALRTLVGRFKINRRAGAPRVPGDGVTSDSGSVLDISTSGARLDVTRGALQNDNEPISLRRDGREATVGVTTRWRKRMGDRDQVGVEFTSNRAGLEGIVPDPRAKGGKGSRTVASAR